MTEFFDEAIWFWAFPCWELFSDYWFQSFYLLFVYSRCSISSWISFDSFCVSKNLCVSSRLPNLLAYNCSWHSPYNLFYFCEISNNVPTSLVILVIWVLSFFLLVSLAKSWPMLLIFSKNQFGFCWSFQFFCSLFHLSPLESLLLLLPLFWEVSLLFLHIFLWAFLLLYPISFAVLCFHFHSYQSIF